MIPVYNGTRENQRLELGDCQGEMKRASKGQKGNLTFNFKDKVVVVTGGAYGIGKCIMEEFTRAGAQVAVVDIAPGPVYCDLYFRGDIANEKVLEEFTQLVIEKYGRVDYLINNAAVSLWGILSDCNYSEFMYVLRVGVAAPYMLTKLFLPCFSKGAAIVNISSTRAIMSQPDTESYSSAKGAISSLTHSLAISLAGKVRVNSISPGWIDKTGSEWGFEDREQHPVKRLGRPLDVARMAMFLCSEDSGFITGQDVVVDGGMSKMMIYNEDFGWKYEPDPHDVK